MLNDLASQDSASGLRRRLNHYTRPRLLVCDEVGYLSYDNRHADLLFEVVTRRYDDGKKPILVTTNKVLAEWNEVFPSATCVVTREIHRMEAGWEGRLHGSGHHAPARPPTASAVQRFDLIFGHSHHRVGRGQPESMHMGAPQRPALDHAADLPRRTVANPEGATGHA